MRKKEKVFLAALAVFVFLELMNYGLAGKVVAFGFIGYHIYRCWKQR